jgi:putative transposase
MEILALFQCIEPYLSQTTLRQFSRIAFAMLVMTGRVTTLGISRWAGKGGSYRTVQRFFYTKAIPWAVLFWVFFRNHLHCSEHVYLLVGDEVVVSKAGKETYGLDRFYASLYGKPIPGLAFFALSLVDVQARRSFPMRIEQVVRTEAEKAASRAKAEAKKQKKSTEKRPRGRPKGSKNKSKTEVGLTPELVHIKSMVEAFIGLITGFLSLTYLVLDGHFGNNNTLQTVRQCGLHLLSKLRYDSALHIPYEGAYCGHGPHCKYGNKLDYRHLPDQYLKETSVEKNIQTCIYQAELLHKEFSQPLNVVIIVKTNLQTGTWAHVLLFTSDLKLSYDNVIDYYCLRFQIEFNFRDAKQYWGLEDFMNVSETAVTNAANLSLFMVNLSYQLLYDFRKSDPQASILDLKAHYRGYRYVDETIKMLPQKPEPFLLAQILCKVAGLGRIHTVQPVIVPS